MANLSSCDSDVLSEVPYFDTSQNDMMNQSAHEFQYSELSPIVDYPNDEITSDSNIIPYSQYLEETQQAILNKLAEDFRKCFVPQLELFAEQKFWLQSSDKNSEEPSTSNTPVKIEVPSELPKVSLVNKCLKKLRFHLASFDKVVKVRTTPNAITEGSWDFEHTKKIFLTEIIPWLNKFKDFFTEFDKGLLDEITKVQTVFTQMEAAVKQYFVDRKCCEIQQKQFLIENDRILDKIISQEIVNFVLNSSVIICDYEKKNENYVDTCNKCLEFKTELVKKNDVYIELSKWFSNCEQHCISLEVAKQLNKEIFQKDKSSDNQNHHVIQEYFEQNDLKAQLQAKDIVISKLKETIHSLRENTNYDKERLIDNVVSKPHATTIALGMFKLNLEPLAPKVLKNKDAHLEYIKHSREHADILQEIVESARALSPLDSNLDSACKVIGSTGASGQKPTGNTKNNRILQSSSYNKTNKVKDQSRSIKSRKNKKNRVAKTKCKAYVMQSMLNANSKSVCTICNECLFDANHDKYVLDYVHDVNVLSKSKPAKRKMPLKEITTKPVVTPTPGIMVYSRRPKAPKSVVQIVLWYLDSGCFTHMIGNRSQFTNFLNKFLGIVKFGNDQIAKIIGYGDYQIGNVTIPKVYYVEGPRHNLFSVGQFCDSDLEVAFCKHTCFVHNLKGVDLLTGSQGTNLYTLSIGDMMKSSPICLLSKASKTKYYEDVGISHETSVARTPQQNGVVKRRNRTLVEAARTMLIYANALLFLWAEAVPTACYTQNRSLIRLRHRKIPYELLHGKKPDFSYLHVFGALCYLTNDSEDLSKLKAKADVGIFIGYALAKKGKDSQVYLTHFFV
ncbi:integrase, catalytic region, zinc finger, CCHC-type containing protein [Tanacetum coccineum]